MLTFHKSEEKVRQKREKLHIERFFFLLFSEREDSYSAWKNAVEKTFEYGSKSQRGFQFQYQLNNNQGISSKTIKWFTVTGFLGVLFYMVARRH